MALESAQSARRAAASILEQGRFHTSSVPNPLHGFLVSVGRALSDPLDAIGRLVSKLGDAFVGGVTGVWVAAALILLLFVAVLAVRRARTKLGQAVDAAPVTPPPGPAELERAAAAAERAQRWEEAVRLRFRAGILRLGTRFELGPTDTTPNHAIGRVIDSPRFDDAALNFEEVVYGGREATAADAEHQREEWQQILAESRGR